MTLKLSHKALILIAVPLLFEVIFGVAMAWLYNGAEQEASRELRSKEIIATADGIASLTEEASVALYSYNKQPDPDSLKRYQSKMDAIRDSLKTLSEMTENNPLEQEICAKATKSFHEGEGLGNWVLEKMKRGEGLEESSRANAEAPLHLRVYKVSRELIMLIRRLGHLETNRGNEVSMRKYRDLVEPLLAAGVLANVFLAVALALFFNSGTTKRLRVLMDNSNRLARGAELSKRLGGNDEIAELDNVFHKMAEALHDAILKERAIIANTVDVICTVDEKLVFKLVSPAALDVFGQTPDDLIGLRLTALILPEDLDRTYAEFERVRNTDGTPFFENRIKRKDDIVDVRWSVHWSDSEKSYYCVVSDISARREIERLKQEFVSMMSHDLRTPLMSIQASLSILSAGAAGDLSPTAQRNVSDAERNIAYIISLINSLIDVERMDSAKLQIHTSPTELLPLMEAAVQSVRSLAANKGIELEYTKVDPDLEVNADGDRIVQVLINLMSNALKFSPSKSTISLVVKTNAQDVEIQVVDRGRGIPASQLDSVFERFKQVQITDATKYKGSGLGLAICKSIVEAHQGKIGVRSLENEGTTFWFSLPLVAGTASGATNDRDAAGNSLAG